MGILPSVSVLMVQPNGKILVGGSTIGISERAPSTMVLVHYNSDGSLDTTFGAGGIVEAVSVVASPALRCQLNVLLIGILRSAYVFL